jgi:hypothetical protein
MVIFYFGWPGALLGERVDITGNQRFAKQPAKLFGPLFPEGYALQRTQRPSRGRR